MRVWNHDGVSVDDVLKFADTVGRLSPLAALFVGVCFVVFVFYKKWLIVGPIHADMVADLGARLDKTEKQRDDALELAAKLTGILEAGRRGSYRGR